jgi:hypothetical protein
LGIGKSMHAYQNVEDANISHNVKTKHEYAPAREVMTSPLAPLIHQIGVAR